MKCKIYLSEAWMCSEFGYQHPMSNKKGLNSGCKQDLTVVDSLKAFPHFAAWHTQGKQE